MYCIQNPKSSSATVAKLNITMKSKNFYYTPR